MTEILSQEEIDALLKAGIGGMPGEEEEEETGSAARPTEGAPPSSGPPPSYGAQQQQQQEYDQQQIQKARVRRSAKLDDSVNVQPAVFTSFDSEEEPQETTNLEIILNLDLEVRVELGKTTKTVKDILEMGSGSVMELEKLNGEPVDLLVNKKSFSKGEMIVIGENFGVRVTDILSIPEIIEALR